jgi:hypothetical protein
MAEERRDQLRTMFKEAADNPSRPSDERAVFRTACEELVAVD